MRTPNIIAGRREQSPECGRAFPSEMLTTIKPLTRSEEKLQGREGRRLNVDLLQIIEICAVTESSQSDAATNIVLHQTLRPKSTLAHLADGDGASPARARSPSRPRSAAYDIEGAPDRNQIAMAESKIMQPNDDVGMNGQIAFPYR